MAVVYREIPSNKGYLADDQGNIYSLWKRGKQHKSYIGTEPRKLKGCKSTPSGHLKVSLKDVGAVFIHRLIYEAFHGEIPSGLVVRHKNDIAYDNRPENLLLGTMKDNSADSIRNGCTPLGEKRHNARFTEQDIRTIRSLSGKVSQRKMAKIYKTNIGYISEIVNKKVWSHVD